VTALHDPAISRVAPVGAGNPAGPMVPVIHRVVDRRVELDDTVTLRLRPVDAPLPPPQPGQFTMLWAPGIGEAPISLAGVDDGDLVHTIRAVGAVTTALCAMEPGELLGVRGPFGTGWELERAVGRDVIVMAGGLGLVPLRPVIRELVARHDEFGRIRVLIGGRSPDTLLYPDETLEWDRTLDVDITVDAADKGWRGHVGVVTELLRSRLPDPTTTTAFVCGPEVMMRFGAMALLDRGLAADDVLVSLERNMHCAIGHCGRCQLGPVFVCKDGPVVPWSRVDPLVKIRSR
jgi:anaerobic sulfite reductase subunit B